MSKLDLNTKLQIATVSLLSLACVLLFMLLVKGNGQTMEMNQAQHLAHLIQIQDGVERDIKLFSSDTANDRKREIDKLSAFADKASNRVSAARNEFLK